MIEILKIKSLGNNRFEVSLSVDGVVKKQIVRHRTHQIETERNLTMTYLTPDHTKDNAFFDMWGRDKPFRKELMKRIKAEVEKESQQIAA
jgi:hypothetical protein